MMQNPRFGCCPTMHAGPRRASVTLCRSLTLMRGHRPKANSLTSNSVAPQAHICPCQFHAPLA